MTPKEKAKELVDKFYTIDSDSEMFDGFTMPIFYAERCALIAVDEILKSPLTFDTEQIKYSDGTFAREYVEIPNKYWQEVKQEIQAL